MDYKYIEQLLERYWICETSLEEESILRAFFSQEDVPASLRKYKGLFIFEQKTKKEDCLGDDFDKRILAITGDAETPKVKAVRVSIHERLMPLFKAAAVVAMVVALGGAAQFQFGNKLADEEINYEDYKDTYNDPTAAYDKVENALEMISEGFSQPQQNDSIVGMGDAAKNDMRRTE